MGYFVLVDSLLRQVVAEMRHCGMSDVQQIGHRGEELAQRENIAIVEVQQLDELRVDLVRGDALANLVEEVSFSKGNRMIIRECDRGPWRKKNGNDCCGLIDRDGSLHCRDWRQWSLHHRVIIGDKSRFHGWWSLK